MGMTYAAVTQPILTRRHYFKIKRHAGKKQFEHYFNA